ncbi:class I SAM-dependent methyltransferase [Thermincola ferriacetica]|uniref:class I SAM-dependent methyltransferase n=1 Tax=Thermincola ferriacetica TaxID=281456 RepID=UPI001910D8B0|nr:class I SAM-dependent methyltransferase [Thermincola ferriacetica]
MVDAELLIPHTEVQIAAEGFQETVYKIIQPERVPFISYPYEWSFSQLKNAALTTLRIQKTALQFGMSLIDATAYNIQFFGWKPVHIDTLSFKKYNDGEPWSAYKQFCQHFLAPLALMSYTDVHLNQLLKVYIDGIPLDLACKLLPFRSRLKSGLLLHLHIHAKSQQHYADKAIKNNTRKMPLKSLINLLNHLELTIDELKWQPKGTEWADYYKFTNYSSDMMKIKEQTVEKFIDQVKPRNVWDLGANIGLFSRLASKKGIYTCAFDIDPAAVEKNYLECRKNKETHLIPLLLDLTNPSPPIGWQNQERRSLLDRGPADMVLALALIHHIAISNNVPLDRIAQFFKSICSFLVIEFVPKSDSQVQKLLATRQDIFPDYTQNAFEREFKKYFTIEEALGIEGSERTLYLMSRKN